MVEAWGALAIGRWPLLGQAPGSFWLPGQDSTTAAEMDGVFLFVLVICTFFFALVVGLMAWFVVHYRRRRGVGPLASRNRNLALEVAWTVIPLGVVAMIFARGFTAYMDMRTAPPGSHDIRVTAQQWSWAFTYPNGYVDKDLHVPAGEPVRLTMTSKDVIHSLSIPDFRVKMDVVPGRYTDTWFQALEPGTHQLYCTEYCGDQHSGMLATVVVLPPDEYEKWLRDAADFSKSLPPVEAGKRLHERWGCVQCHSTDGSAGIGPSFKGIYGETHALVGGGSVKVDDNYIRESILDPQAKIRAGFQPVMSTFQGQLSDEDIANLIEFIKSLAEKPADGQP